MIQEIYAQIYIRINIYNNIYEEVKWAIGSIITNKTGDDDAIPTELFQILKDNTCKISCMK